MAHTGSSTRWWRDLPPPRSGPQPFGEPAEPRLAGERPAPSRRSVRRRCRPANAPPARAACDIMSVSQPIGTPSRNTGIRPIDSAAITTMTTNVTIATGQADGDVSGGPEQTAGPSPRSEGIDHDPSHPIQPVCGGGHDARAHQLDAMAVRMSSWPARRDGRQAATTPASAASTSDHGERSDRGGERRRTPPGRRAPASDPNRGTCRAPTPPSVPKIATITDSQRTVERTSRRVCPTARSSPSSRVRSWIDRRQRVGDAHQGDQRRRAPASRTRRTASGRSPNPMLSMYSDRVCASGAEFRSVTAVTAARPSVSEHAVGEIDEDDHVAGLLGVRGPVGRRHDHVADVHRVTSRSHRRRVPVSTRRRSRRRQCCRSRGRDRRRTSR